MNFVVRFLSFVNKSQNANSLNAKRKRSINSFFCFEKDFIFLSKNLIRKVNRTYFSASYLGIDRFKNECAQIQSQPVDNSKPPVRPVVEQFVTKPDVQPNQESLLKFLYTTKTKEDLDLLLNALQK
jgi:hypothetical protein